jgi:hypothetical protein
MATTAKAAPAVDGSREFALQQYLTLREEIKETKERLFKVMTFGIIGVPAANYLSDRFKIPEILLALPALVLIIALMYLAENHGLMRCGRFIRTHVEPRFSDVKGWERWLEESDERRSVDRYVAYSFFLLFIVYYVGTAGAAGAYAIRTYEIWQYSALIGLYVSVGVLFLGYLAMNLRTKAVISTDVTPGT